MRGQPGTEAYPEFPEIVEAIGYNPARFLHTRSASGLNSGEGQTPEIAIAMSIVKGIDNPEELAYWFKVEHACRARAHVIEKLEQRRRAIKHDRDGFLQEAPVGDGAEAIAADGGVEREVADD
jgi:hypothetical protein